MKKIRIVLLMLVVALVACAIYFGITALIIYGICRVFNLEFSFMVAFGIWLILIVIKGLF